MSAFATQTLKKFRIAFYTDNKRNACEYGRVIFHYYCNDHLRLFSVGIPVGFRKQDTNNDVNSSNLHYLLDAGELVHIVLTSLTWSVPAVHG